MSISQYTNRDHVNAFENCSKDAIVAFAGSGCSYLPGIPTWTDFLDALNNTSNANADIASLLAKGEFYEAASAIYDALDDPADFYNGIATVIDEKAGTDFIAIHQSIWYSFDRVFTTNYDHLFEYALEAYNRPIRDKGGEAYTFLTQQIPDLNYERFEETEKSLAYLHGRAGSQNLVLRREDYQKYYPSSCPDRHLDSSDNLESFLEWAIGKFSFVFIGFSLDDVDFVKSFDAFSEKYKENYRKSPVAQSAIDNRGHFIFLLNDQLKDWLNVYDIHEADLSVDKLIENNIIKPYLHDKERLVFQPNLIRAIARAGFSPEEQARIIGLKEMLMKNSIKLEQLRKLNIRDIRITGKDFNAISRFLNEIRPVGNSTEQIDIQAI